MLSPKKKRKPLGRWGVYDLEWHRETLAVTHAGMRDESGFRCHRTLRELVDDALESGGHWFAHAGGLYDIVQVLSHVIDERPEARCEVAFANSTAVLVRLEEDGKTALFADSAMLLQGSVQRLGEIVGLKKGDLDAAQAAGWKETRDYNETDCEIIWLALHAFEERLQDLGGELRITLASCAMQLFRSAYLSGDVMTSDSANQIAREAYTASRVEPFRRTCKTAYYYDINSSFPYSMTFDAPGEQKYVGTRWSGNELALVEASVTVPESYLPPLPYRFAGGGGVFFPTGRWRGWYTGVDLIEAQKRGTTIDRVHKAIEFFPWHDLKAYALDLYARRKNAKNEVDKLVFKLLLNSLYGKLGENPIKEKLLIRPRDVPLRARPYIPGAWIVEEKRPIEHEHVPAAAIITSRSRHFLGAGLELSLALGGEVYYSDTDSVFTSVRLPDSMVGDELGAWKLESMIQDGVFLAPKLYQVTPRPEADDWQGPLQPKVRAKGFRRPTWEDFQRLVEGSVIKREMFARVRGMLTHAKDGGGVVPSNYTVEKTWRDVTRPKRCFLESGDSRPWTHRELQEKFEPRAERWVRPMD